MKYKPGLSVVLAVYNEEANLKKCLDSIIRIADEIVVVDGQSQDQTVAIARSFQAKVISSPNHQNFHINKNKALEAATHEWTLQLDADEVVSPELAKEIKQIVCSNPPENGYWMARKNWFLNRFLTKGGQYPDPTLRLYRTGKGKLPAQDVHEQAQVEGSVGQLHADLLHYRDTSFEKYMEGFNRYSSFISTQLANKKIPLNIFTNIEYLVFKPVYTFLNLYLRHRGYVDGKAGFIFAIYSGLIHPVSFIKYWQHTRYPHV